MSIATKLLVVVPMTIVAGCVSTSEITQLDRDTYTVAASSTSAFVDNQKLLIESAKTATAYCKQQGKDMVRDDGMLSHQGFTKRQFMFNFRCVEK